MIKIAIGVLAYNEEKNISNIIQNIKQQTIFNSREYENKIQVWIIANGCTDSTEIKARDAIDRLDLQQNSDFLIEKIQNASKTNAWNYFVHDCVSSDFDYICMIDADIIIEQNNLIEKNLLQLQSNSTAQIAVDYSKKYFHKYDKFNLMKYITMIFQRSKNSNVALSGQFYCAKADFLKQIVLPIGLLTQDGFLRAMTLTDGLTSPEDFKRIVHIPQAYHLHPAYTKFQQLVQYNKRQAIGTAIQTLIYKELEKMPSDFNLRMQEIKKRNNANPTWVKDLITKHAETSRKFVHDGYAFRMFHTLKGSKGTDRLKWFLLPIGIIFDMYILFLANREMATSDLGSISANQGKFKIRQ